MKLLIVPTLTLSLIAGCSTLPQGTTIRYTTNEVVEAVLTPVGSVGPTHEVRRQQITMTLVPKKAQQTNIVLMAPPLPAPPLPLLTTTAATRTKAPKGSPTPIGYSSKRLLTTNGLLVNVLSPTFPLPPPAPQAKKVKSLTVVAPPLRAVKTYYAHKEDWHNTFDIIYVSYDGVQSNHVYQFSWTNGDPAQRRPTQDYNGSMIYPTNWTGWSKAQFGYIPWYGPPGALLQVGMSIDNTNTPTDNALAHLLSWGHGNFRLEDVSGK